MTDYKLVPVDTLKSIYRDLDACQRVIWLTGDFDPAYCKDAQARLKEIDELLASPAVQGEPVAVADALRQIATWMDDGGPTYHEAELIGMAISGPVECSSAKQCTKAAKKAFLEAARIWEYLHQSQPEEQQPAPDVAGLVEALKWLRGAINCTPENDKHQSGTWISTSHPRIRQIDELLAAHRKQGGDL